MGFALIIVGDEILSGKRADKHFEKFREILGARGLLLESVRYLGDDRARLVAVLRESFASDDIVFCCGGIGATPDDHTRQAAAAASGLTLSLHPEAAEMITERTRQMASAGRGSADMNLPENRQRLRMGEFPQGAQVVPNPFNGIPGFRLRSHWFLPGFPVMAWPMAQQVLDTHYRQHFVESMPAERAFFAFDAPESAVTPILESIESRFPGLKVFCLPSSGVDGRRRHLELGIRGRADQFDRAFEILRSEVAALGFELHDQLI